MLNGLHVDELGTRRWFVNDQLHREDGPAIEYPNGNRYWFVNDKRQRTDGPAFEEVDGSREWWLNGGQHRTDGPAIERANGKYEWWLNDKYYSFRTWLKKNTKLTAQQKTVLILKYGDQ